MVLTPDVLIYNSCWFLKVISYTQNYEKTKKSRTEDPSNYWPITP